jgi:hypothetical protein
MVVLIYGKVFKLPIRSWKMVAMAYRLSYQVTKNIEGNILLEK